MTSADQAIQIILMYRRKKTIMQYILCNALLQKLIFYCWTVLSMTKQTHRRRLYQAEKILHRLTHSIFKKYPDRFFAYIRKIDALTFEEVLLLSFKARGFKVKHNKAYTKDGGLDGLVVFPDKTKWAIQAKRYCGHINPKHVNQFYKTIQQQHLNGGIFAHTGKTGETAYHNLRGNIVLLSGKRLHQFITESKDTDFIKD